MIAERQALAWDSFHPINSAAGKCHRAKYFWRGSMEKISKITVVDAEKQAQWGKPTGRNYVRATHSDRCHIALNCYEPGVNDELHCHPGSDHTFFVVQGECTMKGLKEDEDFVLKQHQAVHVPAGFFYQLNNTGTERLILYQVSTEPKPRPKIGKVIYGVHTGLKEHLLNPIEAEAERS
jgi:mannose-6-phosphate isomerase-like protein (cupin superfamily)